MENYTIVLNEGTVIRASDGKVVAPCQSDQDPDFLAYIEWVNAGNEPVLTVSETPEVTEPAP
jgi:hypothetical protein